MLSAHDAKARPNLRSSPPGTKIRRELTIACQKRDIRGRRGFTTANIRG
jgi:hypothetical protein